MNPSMISLLAAIEAAGLPALRVVFTIGFFVFVAVGTYIWKQQHALFDPDPQVENDVPVVRHNREELILFVWGVYTLLFFCILVDVWVT